MRTIIHQHIQIKEKKDISVLDETPMERLDNTTMITAKAKYYLTVSKKK